LWPSWMVGSSFAVYLLHPALLVYFYFGLKALHCPDWPCESILNYLISTLFVSAASVVCAVFLSKKAPKLSSLLFGGRM